MIAVTPSTHNIYAYYTLNDDFAICDIATYGDTFEEIIADMLKFANGMPDMAKTFEVASYTHIGDEFKVTIDGEVYRTNEDGDFTEDTDKMTITVEAWKK